MDGMYSDNPLVCPFGKKLLTLLAGEKAKELLLRSNLPGSDLSKIWYVDGDLQGLFVPFFGSSVFED